MTDPKTIRLVIEGPPPRKNRKHKVYATRRKGGDVAIGRSLHEDYLDFFDRLATAWGRMPARSAVAFSGGLMVTVRAYWARQRHLSPQLSVGGGDVDAPLESVLDALAAAKVIDNDARVLELHASKHYDKERPRVEVEIVQLEGGRVG